MLRVVARRRARHATPESAARGGDKGKDSIEKTTDVGIAQVIPIAPQGTGRGRRRRTISSELGHGRLETARNYLG